MFLETWYSQLSLRDHRESTRCTCLLGYVTNALWFLSFFHFFCLFMFWFWGMRGVIFQHFLRYHSSSQLGFFFFFFFLKIVLFLVSLLFQLGFLKNVFTRGKEKVAKKKKTQKNHQKKKKREKIQRKKKKRYFIGNSSVSRCVLNLITGFAIHLFC